MALGRPRSSEGWGWGPSRPSRPTPVPSKPDVDGLLGTPGRDGVVVRPDSCFPAKVHNTGFPDPGPLGSSPGIPALRRPLRTCGQRRTPSPRVGGCPSRRRESSSADSFSVKTDHLVQVLPAETLRGTSPSRPRV